jgi:thiamine phosphate synthase YjbQ (UPF0047 family)
MEHRLSFLAFCLLFISLLISTNSLKLGSRDVHKVAKTRKLYSAESGQYTDYYKELVIPSLKGIHFTDLTKQINEIVAESGVMSGQVNILSRHTTCAITINEMEGRLVDDTRQFLLKLCPPAYPYLHNDLHLRDGPPDWPGGNEAWRAQEPINCHSHLLAMLLGASETVSVYDGHLKIGKWQSIIMAELDGPRDRTIAVHVMGRLGNKG